MEVGQISPQIEFCGLVIQVMMWLPVRNRLFDQGYMSNSISTKFDKKLLKAVQKYQSDHGLIPDGIVGEGTILELNITAEQRLSSIIVALERERWLGDTLGQRHIWVNLADFKAKIIEDHAVVLKPELCLELTMKVCAVLNSQIKWSIW